MEGGMNASPRPQGNIPLEEERGFYVAIPFPSEINILAKKTKYRNQTFKYENPKGIGWRNKKELMFLGKGLPCSPAH